MNGRETFEGGEKDDEADVGKFGKSGGEQEMDQGGTLAEAEQSVERSLQKRI